MNGTTALIILNIAIIGIIAIIIVKLYYRDEMKAEFSNDELDYALTKGIVHYNGDKPWKTWCHHFDIWWEYYRKSPFYDECFYLNFYSSKADELDKLSLWKRVKILFRYFIVGRKS